jgi:hypothetical protein
MKFWVNVENAKHPRPDEERVYTAVYGDINDAVAYAQDYLLPSFGRYEITICDKNLNTVYHEIW